MCGFPLHGPHWGPGPQPRHVSWLAIEPATLWFVGQRSTHWAIPARAISYFFIPSTFFTHPSPLPHCQPVLCMYESVSIACCFLKLLSMSPIDIDTLKHFKCLHSCVSVSWVYYSPHNWIDFPLPPPFFMITMFWKTFSCIKLFGREKFFYHATGYSIIL